MLIGLFQKKKQTGGLRTFCRGFEERICGNSWGQLKKKQNFQGCSQGKLMGLEFPWVLLFDLGTSKVSHNFAEILGVKACFLWNS